jgi:hypothetical protein
MEVRMKTEVVPESLHRSNGGELAIGQIKALPHPFQKAFDAGVEEMIEELAALSEDAAKGFRHGEDELAVRHFETDGVGDPLAGLEDFSLVATGTEMPGLAGEGEQLFVSTIGALNPFKSGGKVATAVELLDNGDRVGTKRAVDGTVGRFVSCLKIGPGMVDNEPERRGAGTARAIDGGYEYCSMEHYSCWQCLFLAHKRVEGTGP